MKVKHFVYQISPKWNIKHLVIIILHFPLCLESWRVAQGCQLLERGDILSLVVLGVGVKPHRTDLLRRDQHLS